MSSSKDQVQPTKYAYKYKFDPDEPKKPEPGEIDRKELQAYIDRLLGIPTSKKLDTANKVV